MSGHSKWATIKRQKGAADVKKGKAFTKLSNAITIAIKQGGGVADPAQNFKLRLAIDAAKAINMPKDNVERAIKRAAGREVGDLQEVIYEGFAPGGIAVMIEAATDNPTRTTSQVKNIFTKAGASFGQPGSVSYQFNQVGQIIVNNKNSANEVLSIALDCGAEDMEEVDSEFFIYTKASDLAKIKDKLADKGLSILEADLIRRPVSLVSVKDSNLQDKIIDFLNKIEDLDDVQKIYSNLS